MQKEHNLLYIMKHITEPKEFQQHKKTPIHVSTDRHLILSFEQV